MIVTGRLRSVWGSVVSLLLAPGALFGDEPSGNHESAGATAKIVWGEHWAGPELGGESSLEGKVILLKIWGDCAGCRGVAPGMVELARKLGDQPFHLIVSCCQDGEKESALDFLKSNGWSDEMTNLSIMHRTRYSPEVEIAHAPYYLIFDQSGKLRYHHVSGAYHGGDGDKYQELVAKLLQEAGGKSEPAPHGLSELRSWANTQGRLIEASLIGVNNGRAKFQMRNGRTYEYPLEKLSPESRKEIAELIEP